MIDLQVKDDRWSFDLTTLTQKVLAVLELEEANVSLLATDDAEIAELNAEFRDKPTPTNVLSWPAEERQPGAPLSPDPFGDLDLGDIALAYETCAREAKEHGVGFEAYTTHLILHGILHLLGYDHQTDAEAAQMEGLESQLMLTMGLHDPYTTL